jgi:hypothetical protein
MNSNQIPVKTHWADTTDVFCACELILLFSLMPCLIRAVYKFDVRLVINWTNHRRRLVKRNRCSTGRLMVLTGGKPTCFLRKFSSEMWKATHAAKVEVFLVSREQYMSTNNSYPSMPNVIFSLNILLSKTLCPLLNLRWNNRLLNAVVCSVLQYTTTENSENLCL